MEVKKRRVRKSVNSLTPQQVLDRFKKFYKYDSELGKITRRTDGKEYGHRKLSTKGYVQSLSQSLDNTEYSIPYHRLCWLLYYGDIVPDNMQVDHINNNKTDNRIVNLQLLSNSENTYKRSIRTGQGSSKYKGVSYNTDTVGGIKYANYTAVIAKDNKAYKIGRFKENELLAAAFYDAANRYLFKTLALTNFKEILIPPLPIEQLRKLLKELKHPMPYLQETEALKKKLDELLERYGYPKIWYLRQSAAKLEEKSS